MQSILNKELIQLRKDYGDLLITTIESQQQLDSLRNECNNLKNDNSTQLMEVNILRKQNLELSGEVARLESLKRVIEGEFDELKKQIGRFEEVYDRERVLVEKLKEQKEKSEVCYRKLERSYNAVMISATSRYSLLEDRVLNLEKDLGILEHDSPSSDSQLVDATIISGNQESNRNERKLNDSAGVQSHYKTTSNVERTTSSMPGSKPMSATRAKKLPQSSESDARPAKDKLDTSVPCIPKPPLVYSSINLANSDDEAELPSPAVLKRKLPTTGASDKREEDSGISRKYTKSTGSGIILQPCALKVEVASNSKFCGDHIPIEFSNSVKGWEYAIDMLDSLQQDTELCMMGVCALSRHHKLSPREKALVKFLTDGDTKGKLKRTVAELEAFNPEGADECKSIVMIYFEELFAIYKKGIDPFFAPNTIFSQKTIM